MQAPFAQAPTLAAIQSRRKTIISLTPLIDVVFILLVFFMLASSFMDWRSLALDTSAAGAPAPSEQTPFVVQVSAEELRLNGEVMTPALLINAAQSRQPAAQPVVLQPVAATQVQALVKVLDALQAAGVQPLQLVDDPEWQAGAMAPAGGDN
jgi:biopolymer transport protein ExbD